MRIVPNCSSMRCRLLSCNVVICRFIYWSLSSSHHGPLEWFLCDLFIDFFNLWVLQIVKRMNYRLKLGQTAAAQVDSVQGFRRIEPKIAEFWEVNSIVFIIDRRGIVIIARFGSVR